MTDESKFKNIRLYDTDQFIVTAVACDMFEGNESQAIRHMIRDYGKRNLVAESEQPAPLFDGNGRKALVDAPAPYTTK